MAHFIFMAAFYSVLTVVAMTLLFALWRSRRAVERVEEIRWHSDFHDLPSSDRVCRHVLTGEFRRREGRDPIRGTSDDNDRIRTSYTAGDPSRCPRPS